MNRSVVIAALALCAACGPPGVLPDGGVGPPRDFCNTVDEALSSAECNLAVGGSVSQHVGTAGDVDFYRVELPAGLTARDLVRIRGGYQVAQTPVSLAVAVRPESGASLGRVVDRHGQGAPRPVELLFRYPTTTAERLIVEAGDEMANPSRPNFDPLAAYQLWAERLTDGDLHEPNDVTATPLPLAGTGTLAGTLSGRLSVANDVDLFSIAVPAGGGARKLLHVRLSAPARPLAPVPYRLSFVLRDPAGNAAAELVVPAGAETLIGTDLATARLAVEGTWRLEVRGYRRPGSTDPVPGDLDYVYRVDALVLDEADANEPNDTVATALTRALAAPGATTSFTGRLDHYPDADHFKVTLAAAAAPTVLHYRLRPTSTGGRFAPLSSTPDRRLDVFTEVTGYATQADAVAACLDDARVCPQGYRQNPSFETLVRTLCGGFSPPRCLQSERSESVVHDGLRNFEGAIPVPPHGAAATYVLRVEDVGGWADDKDYVLELRWLADADDAARYSGGAEQPTAAAMPVDPNPIANGFPVPFAGAAQVSGVLSHGHGRVSDPEAYLTGSVLRAVDDYDAVMTDSDRYVFTLPPADESQGPIDQSWELEWEVFKASGAPVHELAVEVTFCDGNRLDGGACTPVSTTTRGNRLALGYTAEPGTSWHNVFGGVSSRQPLYDRVEDGTSATVTARAYGCFCVEPRFMKGGTLTLNVVALDRQGYEPVTYELRTALARYPLSYPVDGGTRSCPFPDAGVVDAGTPDGGVDAGELDAGEVDAGPSWTPGCRFTYEP